MIRPRCFPEDSLLPFNYSLTLRTSLWSVLWAWLCVGAVGSMDTGFSIQLSERV